MTVTADDVRSGVSRTFTTTNSLIASYNLLEAGNLLLSSSAGSRLRLTVVEVSIVGNAKGLSSTLPTATLVVVNSTSVALTLSALPSYSIDEDEGLQMSVETSDIVGSACSTGTTLGLFTMMVSADVKQYGAPSSVATTVVSGGAAAVGVGGMSGLAAEQQALSALAMFSCADPHSRQAFGSYRALSPFAIYESYAGVVIGNAIVMGVVAVIQACVLAVLRVCHRVRRQVELMATARFPAVLMNVSFAFHTGTAYAASQLISLPSHFDGWEVAVGGIAFAYCVVYPIFLCVHPYYRIGRAYQEYEMSEWLAVKKWPTWVVYFLPQGAMYSPETRKAFGSYVSSYRAPAKEVWWTSYPTWTSSVIALGGLFHPNTIPECQALFLVMGLIFLGIGALCAWRAPLRSSAAVHLNATAKVLTAIILFCLAAAVSESGSLRASNAFIVFGIIQTAVTIIRILHSLASTYFDNKMAKDNIPLSTTWTHVLGDGKKSTMQFTNLDGMDLADEAASRDTAGDALLELEDLTERDMADPTATAAKAGKNAPADTKPASIQHSTSTPSSSEAPDNDNLKLDSHSSSSSSVTAAAFISATSPAPPPRPKTPPSISLPDDDLL